MNEAVERVYLAGPMRGKPQFNFPAFDNAATVLRMHGVRVISPAELDSVYGMFPEQDYKPDMDAHTAYHIVRECVLRDVGALTLVSAIILLEGWENSKGACGEKAVAEWLGIEVYYGVDEYLKAKGLLEVSA